MTFRENRQFRRIYLNLPAFIADNGKTTFGEVYNINNEGVFIDTSVLGKNRADFELHDLVHTIFCFLGKNSTISMTVPGRIIRIADNGVAVHSQHFDTEFSLYIESMMSFSDSNHIQLSETISDYINPASNRRLLQRLEGVTLLVSDDSIWNKRIM